MKVMQIAILAVSMLPLIKASQEETFGAKYEVSEAANWLTWIEDIISVMSSFVYSFVCLDGILTQIFKKQHPYTFKSPLDFIFFLPGALTLALFLELAWKV